MCMMCVECVTTAVAVGTGAVAMIPMAGAVKKKIVEKVKCICGKDDCECKEHKEETVKVG